MYHRLVGKTSIANVAHGFLSGRNVVTAAEQHKGFKSTIMMDISDFFDTVHISMLPKKAQDKYFYNSEGFCGQGFVTSPILANLASISFLKIIKDYLNTSEPDHTFTIYADDLAISINSENHQTLIEDTTLIIESCGFRVNTKKTRIKFAKHGYRRILGINVGDDHIRATRKVMRRMRAANHSENWSSLGGLTQWSNCNRPNRKGINEN